MEIAQLWRLISIISPTLLVTYLILGGIVYRRITIELKVMYFFLVLNLVAELTNRYFGLIHPMRNNLFIMPFYALLEMIIFSILYLKHLLKTKSRVLRVIVIIFHLLVVGDIVLVLASLETKTFQSYGYVIADLLIIFYALLYLFEIFSGRNSLSNAKMKLNYVIVTFFTVNFIIFLPYNFLINEALKIVTFFWFVNLVTIISFYSIITYFIWQNGKTR